MAFELETYAFPVIPEEERAMMGKPKSAPIVLEPARLDNVSQFLSAIGNVDPAPDFPDMPSCSKLQS